MTKPNDSKAMEKELGHAVETHLRRTLCRDARDVGPMDLWRALSLAVRDLLAEGMLRTRRAQAEAGAKTVCYLSMEFLVGRALDNNLLNLGIREEARRVMAGRGYDLDDLLEREPDAALGNGGLGRLAACFLDSMATLGMAGWGYGICYEYGLFRQEIVEGRQREQPDAWRAAGTPWLFPHPGESIVVPMGGFVEHALDRHGRYNPMWLEWRDVLGIPHDMPIVGWGGQTVNTLRLFSAQATRDFDMGVFNEGDYVRAVEQKIASETISKVLYPSDAVDAGRELRLMQEYFLVACAVRDIVRRYEAVHPGLAGFADDVAIQLNDTHPALAVVELLRLFVDQRDMDWDDAWDLTTRVFGYTNHTLMAEALEKVPVPLLEQLLPRHVQILYEINRRFLDRVAVAFPGDPERLRRMSLIEESDPKRVRMANLSIVGSHAVNGVSQLHSELVKHELVPDFYEMWPERFTNRTNGVTPRRWLLQANPDLSALLCETIGPGWITDLDQLSRVQEFAGDASFCAAFRAARRKNKERLARHVRETGMGALLDPDAVFDVQVKRFHEYKRQLLHLLHAVHAYLDLADGGGEPVVNRVHLFSGKAAPGYAAAKETIRLIHAVGRTINGDPRAKGRLRVVFLPDYRVSLAEKIIPAADLSEQISTAGTEASGTSNMKFALNGALTVGTLDGANIEIREAVGEENFFLFGLTTPQVAERVATGYDPAEAARASRVAPRLLEALRSGRLTPSDPDASRWALHALLESGDRYLVLADLDDYVRAQGEAARVFAEAPAWSRRAVCNVAGSGRFSSDRTIREYATGIWDALSPGEPAEVERP